jgi:hypothetical protein
VRTAASVCRKWPAGNDEAGYTKEVFVMTAVMTSHEVKSCIPALYELIACGIDWIGVHECMTDAYKEKAHEILTEAGYAKSAEVFMESHIDPDMAHYRYYHPRVIAKA